MKRLLSIVLIVIVAILSLTVSSGAKELDPTSYKYQANFNRFYMVIMLMNPALYRIMKSMKKYIIIMHRTELRIG